MKLPFEINPFVKSYHCLAFPLGVVQANVKKDFIPALISKYINFCYNKRKYDHWFDFCTYSPWWAEDDVTSSQSIILDKTLYDKWNIDVTKLVTSFLESGYHVHGSYNEKYIPGKIAFNKYDYIHDYIIIGYDLEERVFYSVGYLSSGVYKEFKISFDDYINSLKHNNKSTIEIHTCKVIGEPCETPKFGWLIEELYDYINSTNSKHTYNGETIFGLDSMKKLEEYILYCIQENENINMKYVRLYV